eukprot:EG_transcript_48609
MQLQERHNYGAICTLPMLDTCGVDALHDAMELLVHLRACPCEAHSILAHLQSPTLSLLNFAWLLMTVLFRRRGWCPILVPLVCRAVRENPRGGGDGVGL